MGGVFRGNMQAEISVRILSGQIIGRRGVSYGLFHVINTLAGGGMQADGERVSVEVKCA